MMSKKDSPQNQLGLRLRAQREAIGMKLNHLANEIGANRNTIANYESGKTEPGISDILKICSALGCRLSDLVENPVDDSAPRFAFRSNKMSNATAGTLALVRKQFRSYKEIEEITGSKLQNRMEPRGYDPKDGPIDKFIKGVAADFREKSGFKISGPESIAQQLENLGVRALFLKHEEGRFDGISIAQDDFYMIMLCQREKAVERIIFAAAQELGHLIIHPEIFTESPDEKFEPQTKRDYEKEANIFAGHFLVPSEKLLEIWFGEHLNRLPLQQALLILKGVFQVSYWCLYQRLLEEGITAIKRPVLIQETEKLLGLPVNGMNKMEDLEPEPIPTLQDLDSGRFLRLVRSAFLQELIGVSKVAELLQVTVDDASELTHRWIRPVAHVVG